MMSWLKHRVRPSRLPAPTFRPSLEALDDRRVPAGNVLQTNLVSDLPGVAQHLDPQLVNPWGIAESSGSPFWIADNNAGVSTLYNTAGTKQGLVVNIPGPPPADPLGTDGTPTGTVFNIDGGANGGFKVSANGKGPASPAFLFATEDGTIAAWAPAVDGTHAIIAVNNAGNNFTEPDPNKQTGAVYKGLAIAEGAVVNGVVQPIIPTDPNSTFLLYASNFRTGKIDVFDTTYTQLTLSNAFTDSSLPKGYAPFNVQVLNGKVYVTYAKQDAAKHDDAAGPHRGFVDVYNLDGSPGLANGQERLISRGDLNSPWGLAIAPSTTSATSNFGAQGANLAGALLVGNFGDGRIHAYNATTGAPMGTLTDPDGEPIQIPGLWALKVGNGGNGGDSSTVYFTAGLDHEHHGLFGSLSGVAPGVEGAAEALAEQEMVQAELDVVALDATAVINDINNHAPRATLRTDFQALGTAVNDLARAELRYFIDTHTIYQGSTDQGGATLQSVESLFDELRRLLDNDNDNDNGDH
jgi:uncharacterized protein (TIGR03118 family)